MKHKLTFGLVFVLLFFLPLGNIASTHSMESTSDSTDDVLLYEYSENSGYVTTTTDRDNIDITALSYEYLSDNTMLKMVMEFDGEPEVSPSFFYSGTIIAESSNGSNTFTIGIYYSNFVGSDSSTAASDETLVSISSIETGGADYEVQEIVTQSSSNSVSWEVDLTNFTAIFSDSNYEVASLYGLSGEEINPGTDNTDYYIDDIKVGADDVDDDGDTTPNNSSADLDDLTNSPLPLLSFSLTIPALGLMGVLIRKRSKQ